VEVLARQEKATETLWEIQTERGPAEETAKAASDCEARCDASVGGGCT